MKIISLISIDINSLGKRFRFSKNELQSNWHCSTNWFKFTDCDSEQFDKIAFWIFLRNINEADLAFYSRYEFLPLVVKEFISLGQTWRLKSYDGNGHLVEKMSSLEAQIVRYDKRVKENAKVDLILKISPKSKLTL